MNRPASALAVLLASTIAMPALAESYSIQFQNDSGETVYRIYSSPTYSDQWGRDLLGSDSLEPGEGLDVVFQNVSDCSYDVKIEYASGAELTDVYDLCTLKQYSIR